MSLNASRWNVSVWVEGSTRPQESTDFLSKEAAETYATRKVEEIKRKGWSHKVNVSPVFIHS